MTEDSQNRVRGYGPFPEGAEPTEQIPLQNTGTRPGAEAASPNPELKPEPRPELNPEPKAEARPELKPEPKAEARPELEPQPRPELNPEPQAQRPGTPSTPASPYAAAGPKTHPTPQPAPPPAGIRAAPPSQRSPAPTGIYESQATAWVSGETPTPTSGGLSYGGPPTPTSGADLYATTPTSPPYGPFNHDPDPYGFSAPPGRRIEPSPPRRRSRLVIGLVAGLTAGLLIFGTAGYLTGRATTTAGPTAAEPTAKPSQGVFEQNQITINSADFQGTGLTTLAQGWLPYIATCNRSGTPGGPALNSGEKTRVRCTLDGMSAIFVEYNSVADRDKARVKTLGQAVDARTLTPGVAAPTQRPAPSGRTTGNYVEYAYRLTESGTTRTVGGVWWDDTKTPVAGYLLAYWKEGVGENWEPMRDLWSRYA